MTSKGGRTGRRSNPDSGFLGTLVAWWFFFDPPSPPADGDADGGADGGADSGGGEDPAPPERRRRGANQS
jgi:hypothetical protein